MKNERPAALVLGGGSWELGGLPNKCRVFSLGVAMERKKLEGTIPYQGNLLEAPLRSFF